MWFLVFCGPILKKLKELLFSCSISTPSKVLPEGPGVAKVTRGPGGGEVGCWRIIGV